MKKNIKKIISFVLAIAMILVSSPLSDIADLDFSDIFVSKASAESSLAPTGQLAKTGDVNNDGYIDVLDALFVLLHTVDRKELTGYSLVCADVNDDETINSSDALGILQYTVGRIEGFAKKNVSIINENDALALYAFAVSNARVIKPSYTLNDSKTVSFAEVTLKDPYGLLGDTAELKSQMENEIKSDTGTEKIQAFRGSKNSINNLPEKCLLTDSSQVKKAEVKNLDNGNYLIEICFNDAYNPDKNNAVCKGLGLPDKETALDSIIQEADELVETDLKNLTYSDCYISCELNPITGEFVSLYYSVTTCVEECSSILNIKITSSIVSTEEKEYFGFEYI